MLEFFPSDSNPASGKHDKRNAQRQKFSQNVWGSASVYQPKTIAEKNCNWNRPVFFEKCNTFFRRFFAPKVIKQQCHQRNYRTDQAGNRPFCQRCCHFNAQCG